MPPSCPSARTSAQPRCPPSADKVLRLRLPRPVRCERLWCDTLERLGPGWRWLALAPAVQPSSVSRRRRATLTFSPWTRAGRLYRPSTPPAPILVYSSALLFTRRGAVSSGAVPPHVPHTTTIPTLSGKASSDGPFPSGPHTTPLSSEFSPCLVGSRPHGAGLDE